MDDPGPQRRIAVGTASRTTMESPSPDLWIAVNAALRKNHIPAAVLPTGIEIRLSLGGSFSLPLFPPAPTPSQVADATARDIELTPGQERIVSALAEGPKTAAKLRLAEPNLYRQGAGLTELEAWGLVEKMNSKWQLTDFGQDFAREHGLAEEE